MVSEASSATSTGLNVLGSERRTKRSSCDAAKQNASSKMTNKKTRVSSRLIGNIPFQKSELENNSQLLKEETEEPAATVAARRRKSLQVRAACCPMMAEVRSLLTPKFPGWPLPG